MNKYRLAKSALVALIPALLLQTVYAADCASVSLASGEISGKKVILELLGTNGKAVPQPKKYQKTLKGDHAYFLAPGTHTLILNQWDKRDFISYHKSLRRGVTASNPPVPLQSAVTMQVLANQHYQLSVSEMGLGSVIEIKEQDSKECEGIFIAKAKTNYPELLAVDLPENLQQQLTSMMHSLTVFHQQTADKRDDTNVQSRKLNEHFGTVLARDFVGENIKVDKVISHSLAAGVNIKAGDLIIKLGEEIFNTASNTPSQVINTYLKGRAYGEQISLDILRAGKVMKLTGRYIPVVVPEASYTIVKGSMNDVINQTILPAQLAFEFDQFLLAMNNYYQQMGQGNKIVIVKEPIFQLSINLASVENAQKEMLKASIEGKGSYHKLRSRESRSSGVLNYNMGG
ncbi:hypothetical protein [Colwellia sp. MB02u-14]|uniref:hypothetical protein n=1 Tax=Colwellia sp. MB02u-14 TaxID=2759815 RepID=UPI0015F54571|nr:hypothetical protein [Colwellia sp. MB02u-14]MBA6301991.1 hypothetical protein [Colwellia sp. MB02u-14]